MHSLWFFFLAKRQFSWLFIAALIVAGTYAAFVISKESSPEVIIPIGIVTTPYAGVPAQDIEELITNTLEESIQGIENLDQLTSVSRDGISIITAQFDADADIDESIQNLKDAVEAAERELPEDAGDPFVTDVNFQDQPILVLAISSDLPPLEFTKLADTVSDHLSEIEGVSEVLVSGTREEEIQVVARTKDLLAFNLSLSDLRNAILRSNISVPVGTLRIDSVEYPLRFEGDVKTAEEIRDIPVTNQNGVIVYVRDVADVFDGVARENTISRVSVGGSPSEDAMTLSVFKRAGFDVTVMSENVEERLDALQEEGGLLEGSQVLTVFDQGAFVKRDLSELIGVGFETVALVILCLLLTIGWRESVVAALSIPLSFVIAFIGLYASGNTINFISLFSLILAVGILVDSGIVVTEAIHTRMRKLSDPLEAAHAAIREYAWPLIAGTMTTVAVFVPLFFLSGIVGEFISSIPFTIIFVLIASIIVALGMVPLIALMLTKPMSTNHFEEMQERYTERAQQWYREKLVRFLKNTGAQRIFLLSLAGAFIVALLLPFSGLLQVIFFPPEDVDYVYIDIEAAQGSPLSITDLALRSVEEILYEKEYIASFTSTVGAGSAFTGAGETGTKFGNVTVNLREDRELSSALIAEDLRESLSVIEGADVSVLELANGPPTGAPVSIRFIGDDLETLTRAANAAVNILESIPGTTNVSASTKSSAVEVVLSVDRAEAAARGVPLSTIGESLRAAVFGLLSTTLTRDGEDVDIVLRLGIEPETNDPSAVPEATLDALRSIVIPTQNGSVLLSSLMEVELAQADASIAHEDRDRVETVTSYTTEGTTAVEVVRAFQSRTSELNLNDGVRISYGGETEDINETFREMFAALIAGLLFMLAILVLSFNSIRYSLYLLLAVPLSLIGVFAGLTLTGQSLSFTSLLGVIALAGVIINHAIILMDSMINYRQKGGEDRALIDTVADAAVSRFRPIFLTTITTVIGMIPLSTISSFWSPLAFAIMFGLSFAMILTLILIPTLFYRAEKRELERQKTRT